MLNYIKYINYVNNPYEYSNTKTSEKSLVVVIVQTFFNAVLCKKIIKRKA